MDEDRSPIRQPARSSGGTVEPINRAAFALETLQTLLPPARERFELHDPFAEVTYRANSIKEMSAKAEQLGSTRFTAIDADGKRTPIIKAGGQWQRGEQLPPAPKRPLDPGPAHGDATEPRKTTAKSATLPEQADVKVLAKLEANAERTAEVARLEAALADRYVIKRPPVSIGDVSIGHTEYRFRGDTSRLAFTESTFRLATDTNSPSVAKSMVDVAQTRNWKGLYVSGNIEFRRLVWLEASVRGVKALGYEPSATDREVLKREQQARQINRIEPARDGAGSAKDTGTQKGSARGSGGRKAVIAAIEAVLVAKGVPEARRNAVLAAATDKLAQRSPGAPAPQVKVYDKAAPSQRPVVVPTPEMQRTRDRVAPAPVR